MWGRHFQLWLALFLWVGEVWTSWEDQDHLDAAQHIVLDNQQVRQLKLRDGFFTEGVRSEMGLKKERDSSFNWSQISRQFSSFVTLFSVCCLKKEFTLNIYADFVLAY